MSMIRLCLAASLVLSASCAGTPVNTDNELRVVQPKAKRNRNVITREELQAPEIISRDALTAIRYLRPNFFTYHGPTSFVSATAGNTLISHDYGPLQQLDRLGSINTFGIYEVRFLNAEEAGLRFGLNANGGPVIVLLSHTD
jgi:hypothetical protein